MKREISISKSINYLSEAMSELPKNCLFDKGKVGCGGTTIALTNSENYVIAVPFVSLIENKVEQHNNVLAVYSETGEAEILTYLSEQGIKKIMVTYDSLPRLLNYINPNEYNLLVDEYHLLFIQYSFRKKAAQAVLKNYLSFKSFCFMTATVLDEEFLLDELKEMDIVVAKWESNIIVTVQQLPCLTSVDGVTIQLIKEFLENKREGNAYIFVNSVEFIASMVRKCGLNNQNCRVIYSKSNPTAVGIKNGNTIDCKTNPKKINLLTSTAFEGSDIYDENGKTFIVADNRKPNTLLDISTSVRQIAGRIRNTQYMREIGLITTNTRYNGDLTYNQFKEKANQTIEDTRSLIIEWNGLSEAARKPMTDFVDYYVMKDETNVYHFDPNLVKIDLHNFKICNNLYNSQISITSGLVTNGFNVVEHTPILIEGITRMDKLETTFKDTVMKLEEIAKKGRFYIDEEFENDQEYYRAACVKYNFLGKAINVLGFEGIKRLKYHSANIQRELIKMLDKPNEIKVIRLLKKNSAIRTGYFISAKDAKSIIQNIYDELGITKSPNIKDYYDVKTATKWINGNVVNGYVVILPKMIVKE